MQTVTSGFHFKNISFPSQELMDRYDCISLTLNMYNNKAKMVCSNVTEPCIVTEIILGTMMANTCPLTLPKVTIYRI